MRFARRGFLFILAWLMGWMGGARPAAPEEPSPVFPSGSDEGEDSPPLPFKTLDYFLEEKIHYDISFLWFEKAAEGSLQFVREDNGYKAVLQAETKGFVGFFTSYRKHVYTSHLHYLPEKGKLRTWLFERSVTIRSREDKTTTRLDYGTRAMNWEDYKWGILKEKKSSAIPEGVEYEDIISAFLNFRLGIFGPIQRGRDIKIHTIPEKGQGIIEVHIAGREEAEQAKDLYGPDFDASLMYIKLKVPKEIFTSKTGEVSIWVDERLVPLRGVVKDYIGLGDIRGFLKTEETPAAGENTAGEKP